MRASIRCWWLGIVVCSMIRRDHGANCFVYSCHVVGCLCGGRLSADLGGFLKRYDEFLWFLVLSTGMWLLFARNCWFSSVVVALVSHLCRVSFSLSDVYHVRPSRNVILPCAGS